MVVVRDDQHVIKKGCVVGNFNRRFSGVVTVILLVLGLSFATLPDASAKPAGGESIEDRVSTQKWFCEFTGGSFSSVGWTVPGEQLHTMDSTAVSTCDYGDGDVTTCRDTATTQTCTSTVEAPPEGRGEGQLPEDAAHD
jgi:hypothetical protein